MTLALPLQIHPRQALKSAMSVYGGFLVMLGLTLATDQIAQLMGAHLAFAPALILRSLYAVLGCYIAARFAPAAPMRHALALGFKGVVANLAEGGLVLMTAGGSLVLPIALIAASLPCALIGGALCRVR